MDANNERQLQQLEASGCEKLSLTARHGMVGASGQFGRENVRFREVSDSQDKCGGLADVIEVSSSLPDVLCC